MDGELCCVFQTFLRQVTTVAIVGPTRFSTCIQRDEQIRGGVVPIVARVCFPRILVARKDYR